MVSGPAIGVKDSERLCWHQSALPMAM